jgi:hypothetical protein
MPAPINLENFTDIHLMILFRVATQDGDFRLKGRALDTLYTMPCKGKIGSSIKTLTGWGILTSSPYNPKTKRYEWISLTDRGLAICRQLVTYARQSELL